MAEPAPQVDSAPQPDPHFLRALEELQNILRQGGQVTTQDLNTAMAEPTPHTSGTGPREMTLSAPVMPRSGRPPQRSPLLDLIDTYYGPASTPQAGPLITTQDIGAHYSRASEPQRDTNLIPGGKLPPLPSDVESNTAIPVASAPPTEMLIGAAPRVPRLAQLTVPPVPIPREGVRNALMPQTQAETDDLDRDARSMGVLLNAIGAAPAHRASVAAREGRPIEAVGNAAVAMMPYRPLAGIGTLGAAYGVAIASDLDEAITAASRSRALAAQPAPAPMPGLTPQQQSEYDRARLKLERGQFGSNAERRQLEETMRDLRKVSTDSATATNNANAAAQQSRDRQAQDEYDRAVRRAEDVRNAELARDRRFSETRTGRLFEETGGLAPFAFGSVVGGLSRAATGGGRPLYNYGLPIGSGALAGISAANVPLAYNALFTEPDNPQRRAYEAYARELPPTHPRRQEFQDYAARLPTENPVRREAAEQLYDPVRLAERSGLGAIEGGLGGLAGAELWRIASRLRGRSSGTQPPPLQPPAPSSAPASPNPDSATSLTPGTVVRNMQAARESVPLPNPERNLPPLPPGHRRAPGMMGRNGGPAVRGPDGRVVKLPDEHD